jgi:subtilisin inhibitor-like
MPVSFLAALAAILAMTGAGHPASELTLSLQESNGLVTTVTLECEPPGGTHPHPGRACRTLDAVDGEFERLPAQPSPCPMIWAPVTATAVGHWRDRPVQFTHSYPNRCLAGAESGSVFAF